MKIVLFGSTGQVGWQLRRSLASLGEVVALQTGSADYCGDLLNPKGIAATVGALKPAVIVNAAAYTAVDKAESDPATAMAVNGTACEALASAAHQAGAWLVHYSSDYVYDGSAQRPWVETDTPAPLGVYGRSKLAGDVAITSAAPRHLIFRTSWVYDTWGQNFLKSILRAALTREQLTVVADQWGAPTRAALIADVTAVAIRAVMSSADASRLAGIYHLASGGVTNWHEYASLIVSEGLRLGLPLRATPERLDRTTTSEYGAPAARPRNSQLDTTKLKTAFAIELPAWQDGVGSVVAELAQHFNWLHGIQRS